MTVNTEGKQKQYEKQLCFVICAKNLQGTMTPSPLTI
jgi:hypothetical protein